MRNSRANDWANLHPLWLLTSRARVEPLGGYDKIVRDRRFMPFVGAHTLTQMRVTLMWMLMAVMVNPSLLKDEHGVFVSGNDPEAKAQVTAILKDWSD